jgi:A-kinase anchor protein 18
MRQRDIEQAILLEEKIALQLSLLLDHQNNVEHLGPGAEAMLSNFGSYRDLINDDCDTIEIWRRVLTTVQEISCLASNLYTAATGLPLARAISSAGERQSDMYISPTLPKRAETFGGFDERRNKQNIALPARDAVLSTLAAGYFSNRDCHEKRDSNASEYDTNTLSFVNLSSAAASLRSSNDTINNELFKDHNYAALQVSHHLHTLLCIISQQMTTIQSLQHSLNSYRDNPKTMYRHNDQLEELRNLQDKLQEEKTAWQKQKDQQEQELEEQKAAQKALQEKIKAEQEDIRQQREQLYRKMEILSSQGLLLSPSVALPIPVTPTVCDDYGSSDDHHHQSDGSTGTLNDRRKDKWRTASSEYFERNSFFFCLFARCSSTRSLLLIHFLVLQCSNQYQKHRPSIW